MVAKIESITPQQLVRGAIDLVSLPDIAMQVNSMIVNPKYDANDLGRAISNDPSLTARLLKIVNSSFYGFKSKIDTVGRAITVIGIEDLRNLVLATSAVESFSKIPQDLIDMTEFWMRSVQRGVIARQIAKKCSVLQPERLFVGGLLSDIGSLLIYTKLPDESREILLAVGDNHRLIPGLEIEILGFDHAMVAHELFRLWQLPDALCEAVAYHLRPEEASTHSMDANLIYLANRLCEVSLQGYSIEETLAEISQETLNILSLNEEQIQEAMAEVAGDFSKVFDLMIPNSNIRY